MKTPTLLTLVLVTSILGSACQRTPALETRTFRIDHLQPWEVEPLIGPYVYADRADHPGTLSTSEGAVTVRETADNLERIARVLAEYDVDRPDVRLHFQLIEADGFTDSDPRIADVETELRKIFQFRGYRLAGEAMVTATNNASVDQRMSGSDATFAVATDVSWVQGGMIRLEDIRLMQAGEGDILRTSVNLRPGQTLVLGSSPKQGSSATLLLTVRAEAAGGL